MKFFISEEKRFIGLAPGRIQMRKKSYFDAAVIWTKVAARSLTWERSVNDGISLVDILTK